VWDSTFIASLLRDLTNRIYTFAAIVFVAELSGNYATPVSIFDLQVEGFTLGILQSGAFLVVAQALCSLFFSLWLMNQSERTKQIEDELKKVVDGERSPASPVYSRLRESVSRSEKGAVLIYNSFHIGLPILVGVAALFWSFPDLLVTFTRFSGASLTVCPQ